MVLLNRVKKAKFSKIKYHKVTTAGDQGATAVQQATGNLARAGVATTKNVAKGTAKKFLLLVRCSKGIIKIECRNLTDLR